MRNSTFSRRRLLEGALVAGTAAVAAPAIIRSSKAQAKELVFVGFGGAYQEGQTKAFFEPFEEATGIKIVQTTGVELAKLKAQVDSGNVEWDLICLPDRLRFTALDDELLTPLDYSRIDTSDLLADTVTEYCCGGITFAASLTYNTEAFPEGRAPVTWQDVWNTDEFPGTRGMYSSVTYQMEFALIADGVPKDQLYPIDVDRALKSMEKFKSDGIWWSQWPQVGQMLLSQEIVTSLWTRGIGLIMDGEPIGISYDGAAISYEGWVIPKGSKNVDAAMEFIQFAIQPERQAELTKYVSFGPTNSKAFPLVDPKLMALLPSQPENFEKGFLFNGEWWGPNLTEVSERFNEWRLT